MTHPHVLVAYCTRSGSTAGVAERIAARLRDRGCEVELREAGEAGDPVGFDGVVLGSPVFDQSWMPEADAFVAAHLATLAQLPVWLFSVGTFGDSGKLIGLLARCEPRNVDELLATVRPKDYRVFAGVIDRKTWPSPSRPLFHALGGHFGDNRDWPAIDAWAERIADELQASGAQACTRPSTPTA